MNFEAVYALRRANQHLDVAIELMPNPFEIDEEILPDIIKTLESALEELDRAANVDPDVTATVEVEAGEREVSVQTTRSAIMLFLGMATGFGSGDADSGAAMIEESIEIAPAPFGNAHYALAIMYADSGRLEDGLVEIHRAIELDPDNDDYREMLSAIQTELNN